jgi:hypothetical protein
MVKTSECAAATGRSSDVGANLTVASCNRDTGTCTDQFVFLKILTVLEKIFSFWRPVQKYMSLKILFRKYRYVLKRMFKKVSIYR